jgi:hypothetical protein
MVITTDSVIGYTDWLYCYIVTRLYGYRSRASDYGRTGYIKWLYRRVIMTRLVIHGYIYWLYSYVTKSVI